MRMTEEDFYEMRAERDRIEMQEVREREFEERMEACSNGFASYRAACAGGDEYAMEMRESAALFAVTPAPIACAVSGWLRAIQVAA